MPKLRVFPRLGLAIGLVDRDGAPALASDPNVAQVTLAQELSLIQPVACQPAARSGAEQPVVERADRLQVGGGQGDVIDPKYVRHGWPPALRRHSVPGPLIHMRNAR
jgi:hypothetical protein